MYSSRTESSSTNKIMVKKMMNFNTVQTPQKGHLVEVYLHFYVAALPVFTNFKFVM